MAGQIEVIISARPSLSRSNILEYKVEKEEKQEEKEKEKKEKEKDENKVNELEVSLNLVEGRTGAGVYTPTTIGALNILICEESPA